MIKGLDPKKKDQQSQSTEKPKTKPNLPAANPNAPAATTQAKPQTKPNLPPANANEKKPTYTVTQGQSTPEEVGKALVGAAQSVVNAFKTPLQSLLGKPVQQEEFLKSYYL